MSNLEKFTDMMEAYLDKIKADFLDLSVINGIIIPV